MRLNKQQLEHMSYAIIRNLIKENKIIVENRNIVLDSIIDLLTRDFEREDKLDQEVREILNKHMEKIRRDNIEYQTMFRMIKTKLAKERDLVL